MKTKTDRVVLNLQQSEAIELNKFIGANNSNKGETLLKISAQLARTIAKNKAIDNLRKSGPEPTKEMVDKAMISVGVKKAPIEKIKPVPKKALSAITQAVEEVEKELKEGTKCPSCDGIMLPEPDGTLLCESCGAVLK